MNAMHRFWLIWFAIIWLINPLTKYLIPIYTAIIVVVMLCCNVFTRMCKLGYLVFPSKPRCSGMKMR